RPWETTSATTSPPDVGWGRRRMADEATDPRSLSPSPPRPVARPPWWTEPGADGGPAAGVKEPYPKPSERLTYRRDSGRLTGPRLASGGVTGRAAWEQARMYPMAGRDHDGTNSLRRARRGLRGAPDHRRLRGDGRLGRRPGD